MLQGRPATVLANTEQDWWNHSVRKKRLGLPTEAFILQGEEGFQRRADLLLAVVQDSGSTFRQRWEAASEMCTVWEHADFAEMEQDLLRRAEHAGQNAGDTTVDAREETFGAFVYYCRCRVGVHWMVIFHIGVVWVLCSPTAQRPLPSHVPIALGDG